MSLVNGQEVDTSECDKMSAVHEKSQAIGEFLEWLSGQGIRRMKWEEFEEDDICGVYGCNEGVLYRGSHSEKACSNCDGTGLVLCPREGWYPDQRGIEQLLAEFFQIDLKKVDQEQRAILEALRT